MFPTDKWGQNYEDSLIMLNLKISNIEKILLWTFFTLQVVFSDTFLQCDMQVTCTCKGFRVRRNVLR